MTWRAANIERHLWWLGNGFLCILMRDIRVGTELCSSMYRIASFALHREAQQRFRNIKDAHSSHGDQKPHKSLTPGRSLSLDAYGILNPANKKGVEWVALATGVCSSL